MCRNGGRRPFRLALLGLVAGLGLGLAGSLPAAAQSVSSPQDTGIELTVQVQRNLQQLQELWLRWISANNPERSAAVVDDLLSTAGQLGMTRLPDLSLGALFQAAEAARAEDFGRARWALAAAERLDPGRPETSFARSRVAWSEGRPLAALGQAFAGFERTLGLPLERSLLLQDLAFWTLCLVLLAGALFTAVQMAVKGGGLLHDLTEVLVRLLPRQSNKTVARVVAAALLLWPLVLPYGLVWMMLLWSLLLWGYGSRSERGVLIALWLVLGAAPFLVAEQRQRAAAALSPPVHAMASLSQGRLYGALFTDLGVLRALLPESPAVQHLLADVHRTLGQWELARTLYRQVLEKEPNNAAALLNIGVHFFHKGDFSNAIQHFRKAASADPASAAALFNLSLAYSRSYLFDDMAAALAQARAVDGPKVEAWLKRSEQQRIVVSAGGLARVAEIRRQLQDSRPAASRLEVIRRGLAAILGGGLVLLAFALHFARRRHGYTPSPLDWRLGQGLAARWRRILLPGIAAAEAGEGLRTYLALLVPAALLTLPLAGDIGFRTPWGYDPGTLLSWTLAVAGLLLYLGARFHWERRNLI
jgi:tetratricopeptide (TPR) repeat protein